MKPFPWSSWIVAVRDTLRWFLDYQPPPGQAASAEIEIKTKE
jgi:hypothetical protein